MERLKDFRSKDFAAQIAALDAIRYDKDLGELEGLFDLYTKPVTDKAVANMTATILREMLQENEEGVLRGLASSSPEVQRLCALTAADKGFASTVPALLDLARDQDDPEILMDLLTSLSRLDSREALPLFRDNMRHPDQYLASLCLETAGRLRDMDSFQTFRDFVLENEQDHKYEVCEVTTWKAVDGLAALGTEKALAFLAEKIHHRNPTARRLIHEALTKVGQDAVSHVAARLSQESEDERIMAANVLGRMGLKSGGDQLVRVMDQGRMDTPNLRFAALEALGNIPCLKSLVCLLDELTAALSPDKSKEPDPTLVAALTVALNNQPYPGAMAKITTLAEQEPNKDALLKAVVATRSGTLFKGLYPHPVLGSRLTELLVGCDGESVDYFIEILQGMGQTEDAARIKENAAPAEQGSRLLAVDDSTAMLSFYRSAASQLGLAVVTAENGQEALAILDEAKDKGERFDLVLVDMNMPVMDGVEFTVQARTREVSQSLPIIMATTESEQSQCDLAQKNGVTAFLIKPFTLDGLRDKITMYLQGND